MDPDAALRRLVELSERLVQCDSEDLEWDALHTSATEFAETFLGLDEWLRKDGFLPAAWQRTGGGVAKRKPRMPRLDADGNRLQDGDAP